MLLREYLDKYKIGIEEFCMRTGYGYSTIYAYMSGAKVPSQKASEIIEKETAGRVTVKELRGKDDRKKP